MRYSRFASSLSTYAKRVWSFSCDSRLVSSGVFGLKSGLKALWISLEMKVSHSWSR